MLSHSIYRWVNFWFMVLKSLFKELIFKAKGHSKSFSWCFECYIELPETGWHSVNVNQIDSCKSLNFWRKKNWFNKWNKKLWWFHRSVHDDTTLMLSREVWLSIFFFCPSLLMRDKILAFDSKSGIQKIYCYLSFFLHEIVSVRVFLWYEPTAPIPVSCLLLFWPLLTPPSFFFFFFFFFFFLAWIFKMYLGKNC